MNSIYETCSKCSVNFKIKFVYERLILYLCFAKNKVYILSITKFSKDRKIQITFLGDICINNVFHIYKIISATQKSVGCIMKRNWWFGMTTTTSTWARCTGISWWACIYWDTTSSFYGLWRRISWWACIYWETALSIMRDEEALRETEEE